MQLQPGQQIFYNQATGQLQVFQQQPVNPQQQGYNQQQGYSQNQNQGQYQNTAGQVQAQNNRGNIGM